MNSKQLTYFILIIGAALSIYAQWSDYTNIVLASIGIASLMFGLFRLSKGIKDDKPQERYILDEDEEE